MAKAPAARRQWTSRCDNMINGSPDRREIKLLPDSGEHEMVGGKLLSGRVAKSFANSMMPDVTGESVSPN